jgi:hypothetical protein
MFIIYNKSIKHNSIFGNSLFGNPLYNECAKENPMQNLSYAEVLSCLEDAKQGQLSPYWQGYAKRELDSLRDDTGALLPDAEILANQLQSVLASTPQISDHIFIENEATAQGNS